MLLYNNTIYYVYNMYMLFRHAFSRATNQTTTIQTHTIMIMIVMIMIVVVMIRIILKMIVIYTKSNSLFRAMCPRPAGGHQRRQHEGAVDVQDDYMCIYIYV